MLWTGGPSAALGTNNIGATYSDFGIGTTITSSGSFNAKGSTVNMLSGLARTQYGLWIWMSGGNTTTAFRKHMVDVMIDPNAGVGNAGSTWSVFIANLAANSPAFSTGGVGFAYYFPIILPQGAALGARSQNSFNNFPCQIILGTPTLSSRVDVRKFGTQVQTLGATTSTTSGVAVTPGTSAKGSWSATLGTLTRDAFWFQLGILSDDSSMTENGYLFDLAAGPSQEKICIYDMMYGVVGSAEQAYKSFGQHPLQRVIASGSNLYARGAACGGAPSSAMSIVAYAVS
jgi:hypothetical protein